MVATLFSDKPLYILQMYSQCCIICCCQIIFYAISRVLSRFIMSMHRYYRLRKYLWFMCCIITSQQNKCEVSVPLHQVYTCWRLVIRINKPFPMSDGMQLL